MIKILIVEDEEIIRKGLINTIDWLSKDCTIIGEAINGKDGLEKIESLSPDLVITDIRMPVLDGLEMIREAMQQGKTFEKIILTSYGEFEYAKESINLGVVEYILKPIDEDILYEALDKVREKLSEKELLRKVEEVVDTKDDMEFFNIEFYFDNNIENKYVRKSLEKIKNYYYEKLNIKDLSEEFDVSTGYLSRKFKEEVGETFLDILNKYRIQKSIKLLMKEEYKLYEISEKVGFTDYKHFCTVFKKYLNVAPGDFLKQKLVLVKEEK
ncbi:response regulator transcription factor [Fusobacterium perfoetens]|uniref:response regulator transcription factor n=1 Tax=Fusobacterium perfoetens TaxID=852 RepID=UPI00048403DC|nr:response regulator [Fusobacterium perfoetens]MCI6153371.1 response regulator [Fusobacterium perfoetens]MDY3238485.1 response regulator [Fusobacterium perfoetens]